MKKIVVVNTKTGEVQSVEKYIRNSSEIWVAGWIGSDVEEMINPEHTRRAIQSAFQKLDTHEGNIQNMNHRLELQENATYEFSNQLAGLGQNNINPKRIDTLEEVRKNQAELNNTFSEAWMSTNRRLDQMITGFDGKIVKIIGALEDLNERTSRIENLIKSEELIGLKTYTLQEFDTIIKELNCQKNLLENHLELAELSDAQKLRELFKSKGSTKKPAKKSVNTVKKKKVGRPKKA